MGRHESEIGGRLTCMTDPPRLAADRGPAAGRVDRGPAEHPPGREFDVVMQGTVFLDIVLTGLTALPSAGTEIPAEGMGSCPGGIANLAIAASRLGLRTSLAASFGDDLYGDFLVRTLQEEGIDLSLSRRISQWHSPVTVSLAVQRDRAMITHSHPSPVPDDELISRMPSTAAGVVHLGQDVPDWIPAARAQRHPAVR